MSLREYLVASIAFWQDKQSFHGVMCESELKVVLDELDKAIEKIDYIRLAEISCDADIMRDKILEILTGKPLVADKEKE